MCCGEKRIVIDTLPDKANSFGFSTIKNFAKDDCCHCCLRASDAAQHPGVTTTRVDTNLQKTCVELCAPCSYSHVTTKSKVHTCPYCCTIDRRNGGQWAARNAQKAFINIRQAFWCSSGKISQVGTSTKSGGSTGDHNCTDGRIVLYIVHGGQNVGNHWRGQSITFGRII